MKIDINKLPYIGNGAYCYANSTSMLLNYIGENISSSTIEVLTGVGLGASLKKKGGLLYFNNQMLLPDLGISKALAILGFSCDNKVSKKERDFPLDELREDLDKMPIILGPLDMGYLNYNPNNKDLKGVDHYVLAYKIRNEEVYLHDPAGFPFVLLSVSNLRKAWKADRIGYKKGYYRYITSIKRIRTPTEKEIYDTALDFFRNLYIKGEKKTSRTAWFIGQEAILHIAKKTAQQRLANNEIGHFVYFALPLGAKRALDFASFFDYQDKDLASLKRRQAQLFGEAHVRTTEKNWDLLAKVLVLLSETEEDFRKKLLKKNIK